MKTIGQALIDEIHYPVSEGMIENKLIMRGLCYEDEFSIDVAKSSSFVGAVADCLYSLIEAPNFSEADKSISLSDKSLILSKVNSLYKSIGEQEKTLVTPMVYIVN